MNIGFIVAIFAVFYLLLIRPQRKKEKESKKMRDELRVGDEIVTIGGIEGRIVNVKDDAVVIESGADRNKIRMKKWAVQTVVKPDDEPKKQ